MNRRQFLGRVFQGIITTVNDNYVYGAYHPWRQYSNAVKYSVTIYLKIKTGVDSGGNPTYSNLSNTQKYKTIMGVFDPDGNLIYCSAYRRNGNVTNSYAHIIRLSNLTPGNYTVQCLQYGIGVGVGSSGNIMTFTVPTDFDRSQAANNNYGYISPPTLEFYYYFNYAGLIFSADVNLVDVGNLRVETDLFKTYSMTVQAPTYAECKALYEPAAKEIGKEDWEYTNEQYMECILRNIGNGNEGALIPGADECDGQIQYSYPILHVKYTDGVTEENVASVDFSGYISDASAYWLTCMQNNLDYNMDAQDKYSTGDNLYYKSVGAELAGTSGSFKRYYCDNVANLHYTLPDVYGWLGDYIANVGCTPASAQAYALRYKNCKVDNISMAVSSTRGSMAVYDDSGSSSSYSYSKAYLNINWSIAGKLRKCSSTIYERAEAETEKTVASLIAKKIANAVSCASKAAQKYKQNNDYNDVSYNGQIYQYPLAALFGKIPAGRTLARHFNPPPETGKQCEVVVNKSHMTVGVAWNSPWQQSTDNEDDRYLRPMLDNYLADLSAYDPDGQYNNTSMWIGLYDGYNTSRYMFLRQNIVEVNTGVIPNR